MITLFRRIRQKLIDSGSLTKYLFYATGEILLVVIGILIALQVNNWNEQRKSREAELFLLSSLKEDFELRYNELLEFDEARAKTIDAIHELNSIIHNPDELPASEKMDSLLALSLNALSFNDQFKTLDMLFSTGMINDLQNEQLKQSLIQWPQQVEEMMEEQRARGLLRSSISQDLMFKYIAIRDVNEKFTFRGYELKSGQPVTFPSDYPGLIADPAFERSLAQLEFLLQTNDRDSKILIKQAELIISFINREIEN
ncbi:MAG: hypothetical protein GVY20_16795 [Bacteroidetes bacterium]|jgi:hypothetical protein|nr:hypothetical protein [Bacteroidota bacterium]